MITSRTIAFGIVKAVGILLLATLLLYFVYAIKTIILYLIISIIFTLIANPIVEFFKRKFKFSNTLAVVSTLLVFIFIILGIISLFVPLILSQSDNLSLLNTQIFEKDIFELSDQINTFLKSHNLGADKIFHKKYWISKIDYSFFTSFFNSILSLISDFGIGLASVFFISFFLLKDKVKFLIAAKMILPVNQKEKILNSASKIHALLSRYFIGLSLQLLIIFILYLTVLLILGIENAFIIAFLCAILNIIPYIGPLIGSVIAGVLTMLSNLDSDFQTETLPLTLYVLIGFIIVQLIDNNISGPLIFSKSVKSHPLEIFLVILVSGFLFGILGMIIAVPFYTIAKVISKEFMPKNILVKILTKNI